MRKLLFLVLWILLISPALCQDWLKGELVDTETSEGIPFAHVKNLSKQKQTITNREGLFRIPANVGDSILISIVGYKQRFITLDSLEIRGINQILLSPDTVLLNEVIINRLPEEEVFKQRILGLKMEDSSFNLFGIPPPEFRVDKTLDEKHVKNPLFLLAHPITGWHYRFSKSQKERRKVHKIENESFTTSRVQRKFTRDWVGEVTNLDSDELTDFLAYCDFAVAYIDRTPLYIIQEEIIKRLLLFKNDSLSNTKKG